MIDRERRNRYAEQLRHFAAGVLTVEVYEARTDEIVFGAQDAGLSAMWGAAWCLYDDFDDFSTERLRGEGSLDAATRLKVARMILFLYSDAEYLWPEDTRPDILGSLLSGVIFLINLVTLSLVRRLFDPFFTHRWQQTQRWMAQFGDLEFWPFLQRAEYETAVLKPRFFAGPST